MYSLSFTSLSCNFIVKHDLPALFCEKNDKTSQILWQKFKDLTVNFTAFAKHYFAQIQKIVLFK